MRRGLVSVGVFPVLVSGVLLAAGSWMPIASAQSQAQSQNQLQAQAQSQSRPQATVQTLISRPDLRPPTVTLKKDYTFNSGRSLRAGTELPVHAVERDGVVLDAGPFIFKADVADTDLLDRARALIAGLSDEALAVTYATLPRQPELWPTEVTLRSEANLGNGRLVPAGTVLVFNGFERQFASVYDLARELLFNTEPDTIDLLDRARAMTATPKSERRPFIVRCVEAAIASSPRPASQPAPRPAAQPGTGREAIAPDAELARTPQGVEEGAALDAAPAADVPALAGKDFLLVVRGGSTCPRCQAFLPELATRYAELRERYDNFELIYIPSVEHHPGDHERFVREMRTPGIIIPYARRHAVANLPRLEGRLLPIVHLIRPDGTIIFNAHPDGRGTTPSQVIDRLEQELARTR